MIRVAVMMGQYPAQESARRAQAIQSLSTDEIDVDVIEIAATPYTHGFGISASRDAVPAFVAAFQQAEAENYDAVVPLGVLDIAVVEGRRAVGIPVIGPLSASLYVASARGRRAGLIVYSENLVADIAGLVERYGASDAVGGFGHVGTDLTDLADRQDELEDRFCAAARQLITDRGVDVIISAGISLCPVYLERKRLERLLHLPVVEAIGSPVHLAASIVRLSR